MGSYKNGFKIKCSQCKTLVLSILLYVCDAWTTTENMENKFKPSKINRMNLINIVFNFILDSLTYIFNLIACDSTIPDNIKIFISNLTSFKNGKLDDINNYRPIALLSQFSKNFDNIIANRFLHFIDKHNLLYAKQYGFIKNSSTSHALYAHYNCIELNLERNNKSD